MSEWKRIESAPKDGTEITTAKKSEWIKTFDWYPYPLTSRFEDGLWKTKFNDVWATFEPQPTHWMPLQIPPEEVKT